MLTKRTHAIVYWAFAGFTLLFCLSCLASDTVVLEVLPGESIQSALRRAEPGDTIKLLPGTYNENLRIDHGVRLVGDPNKPEAVIINSQAPGPIVLITGSLPDQTVLLQGMTLRGAFGYLPDGILHAGAISLVCSNLIVEDCASNGLTVAGESTVDIDHCIFRANSRLGIDVQNAAARVEGEENILRDNGADLGGYALPSLRTPLVPQTSSQTIVVPEQYSSLQEAIDAAPSEAIIIINEGMFETGLTIWKSVTLVGRGQSATTLVPTGSGTVSLSILATTRYMALEHLTIMATEQRPIAISGELALRDVAVIGQQTVNLEPILDIRRGGALKASDCQFSNIGGIAIRIRDDSSLNIDQCSFTNNHFDLAIEGASQATILNTQFSSTREQAVSISDARFYVADCTFKNCMDSLAIAQSMGALHNIQSLDAARNGISLYQGAHVIIEASNLTGSGNYNLLLTADAYAEIASCTLSQAAYAGIAAQNTAEFKLSDCTLSENGGAGLIIAEQARGEIESCSIRENGAEPAIPNLFSELPAGGIVASMNSHLVLRDCDLISNHQAGLLIDPVNPFYDDMLSLTAHREIVSYLPVVALYGCRIEETLGSGISALSRCELSLVDCSLSSNDPAGILLDGTAYILSGGTMQTMNLVHQDIEGMNASITDCEIRDNRWLGIGLEGLAAAEVQNSRILNNSAGIGMDITARLDLLNNQISSNASYGILFTDDDYQQQDTDCVPAEGRLTGFGNAIPGPAETEGNGVGAFTAGSFPCLILPEGCPQ